TYSNLEIIVVDDGSPDNTSEVAARYPGVQCIRQKNGGLSDARNRGIRESRGEFLVLLDADDKLLPNCFEAGIVCFAERPEAAIVFGRYQVIQEDGAPTDQLSKLYEGEDLYRGLLSSNCISMVATVMFRREIFDKVGYFKPALACAEDYDLYLRIASRFPSNRHREVVAEYRVYGSSISNDLALMLRGVSITLKSQRKIVKGNREYEDVHRAGLKFWREYYGESLYIRT